MTAQRKENNNRPTSLYRFFDSNDQLIYVGITSRHAERWDEHGKNSAWWLHVDHATISHFQSRTDALHAEAEAIENEKPLYNVSRSKVNSQSRRNRALMSGQLKNAYEALDTQLCWSITEAAMLLGVQRQTLARALKTERLTPLRIGGKTVISSKQLKQFISGNSSLQHSHRGRIYR